MFDGHCSSASRDVKYLICHVASQNYVIEGSSNFMSRSASWYHLTKFGGHRYCTNSHIMVLVCQVIKQNHVIKRSGDNSD